MHPTLLPTPQNVHWLPTPAHVWRSGATCRIAVITAADEPSQFTVRFLTDRLRTQFGLRVRVQPLTANPAPDLVLCGNGDPTVAALLHKPLTPPPSTRAQSYAISVRPTAPAVLFAHTAVSLLYAAATFLQLLTPRGRTIHLPHVQIHDWPAFPQRGNSWLLRAELEGWSYTRGDSLRAYEARVLRKLDLCALHKINFLHFDGLNWDTDKFPGYAPLLRRLNHAARLRGIRLSCSGFGAYGDGFENRRSYPKGDTYPCLGPPDNPAERCRGTCLSNAALIRLRQARLTKFVTQVHPGALYLHGIDTGTIADSTPIWTQRCPACRKRWPNDQIIARDGMAGAFAAFYDAIASAVHKVDPDCQLMVVSPCYTGHLENDAQWELACQYWVMVSQCLRDRKIFIGLREQFAGDTGQQPRYAQLRTRLDRDAHGHRIASIHFFGGDCFYSSHTFLATPMLSSYFAGADLVVNGNGHAYQEPQQLLNAECLWNPRGSRWFTAPPREPFAKLFPRYLRLSRAALRPPGIWGTPTRPGLLDHACAKLYGPKAGPLVARMHRLVGHVNLRGPDQPGATPLANYHDRTQIWAPIFNYYFPTRKSFRHAGITWQPALAQPAQARRLAAVYRDSQRLNRQAIALARRAARASADRHIRADLEWLAATLAVAQHCAALFGPFIDLFLKTHALALSGKNTQPGLAALARFGKRVDRFQQTMERALPRRPLLPQELDLITRRRAPDVLRRYLTQMTDTLRTGQWPK